MCALISPEEARNLLEWELQAAVSLQMGAGNGTQVLFSKRIGSTLT